MTRRFPIKLGAVWRPVLIFHGATRGSSYVEVSESTVTARLGWNRIDLPRAEIAWARRESWPWWRGVGWAPTMRGGLGVIGAKDQVVRIHLRRPRLTLLSILPVRLRDVYVSVDDPEGLIAALTPA